MDPRIAPEIVAKPSVGMAKVTVNPGGGRPVEERVMPAASIPATNGINPWTSSSWVTAWLTRALGAVVVVIGLFGWAVPEWFQGYVDDPKPLGAAIATLVGLALAVLGEIGKRGRENQGQAASRIIQAIAFVAVLAAAGPAIAAEGAPTVDMGWPVLIGASVGLVAFVAFGALVAIEMRVLFTLAAAVLFLTSCANLGGPNYGKLDPADPATAVILERDATTFSCEQYVASTAPFRQQQRLHLAQPDKYQPVDPILWEGITQLRWTVGETCADPQGVVSVDMATIPPGASGFITNFILTGSIR